MSVKHDEHGREIPDPTVLEVPLHLRREESLHDRIRRMVREQASYEAAQAGFETFEESDDFSVDEDEFASPHELSELQEETPFPDKKEVASGKPKEVDSGVAAPPVAPVAGTPPEGVKPAEVPKVG